MVSIEKWGAFFCIIILNFVLILVLNVKSIENSPLAYEDTFRQLCEAKILRAYYYYILTSFFGDVPFYRDYVKTVSDLDNVASLPRMSAVETRKSLCEELLEIAPKLQQIPTCQEKGYRCGAAMAWMLIAKMSMWNKDWQTALDALKNLELIYGDLSKYPISDIMFRNKNTPESIFEVPHTYSVSGLKVYSNLAAVMMPYDKEKDENTGVVTYGGIEVPQLGADCTVWQPLRPNSFMHKGLFAKNDTKDLRKDMTLVWSWEGKKFSRSWSGPKFWCYDMYATYDYNNYTIFRYADAVLMLAECYNEIGDHTTAIKYLNHVKSRAGLDAYERFVSKSRLLEEIQNERGRELAGEFQRKFDLVRWGNWYQRIMEYNDYDNLKNNVRACHEYYPIPDTEVALSDGKLDNKAYEQGL